MLLQLDREWGKAWKVGSVHINHRRKCCNNPPKGVVEQDVKDTHCGARCDTLYTGNGGTAQTCPSSDLLHYKQISVKFSLICRER